MDSANELREIKISWDGSTVSLEFDGFVLEGSEQFISIPTLLLRGYDVIVFNGVEYVRTV